MGNNWVVNMIANKHKIIGQLPAKLEPNAEYFVRAGSGFDLYVADSTGQVAHKINQNINGNLMILGENVWSVVNLPIVNEIGVATKTIIDKDNEHYRVTIKSFRNNASLARFDNCLANPDDTQINVGDNYRLSFEIRGNKTALVSILYAYFGALRTLIAPSAMSITEDWRYVEFGLKANGVSKSSANQLFGINLNLAHGWQVEDWYEIRNLKMQKLNYATVIDIDKMNKHEEEIQRIKQHLGLT